MALPGPCPPFDQWQNREIAIFAGFRVKTASGPLQSPCQVDLFQGRSSAACTMRHATAPSFFYAAKLTCRQGRMPLMLQHDLKKGDVLLSLGEFGRLLNIPESRMEKAVAKGVIQPIGVIGRNSVVAMSSRDFLALDDAVKRLQASMTATGELPGTYPEATLPPAVPELPAPTPVVLPNTFCA
jgi:hypothetical protein